MRRLVIVICGLLLADLAVLRAQDVPLVTQEVVVVPEIDVYGQEALFAEGLLLNAGTTAYSSISLFAEAFDAAGDVVGEGFGYLVNACDAALLPDVALPPGAAQRFAVPLELFEDGVRIERVEVMATGSADPDAAAPEETPIVGVTRITNSEVVSVEWIDGDNLRYGVGCHRDLFIDLRWMEYNLTSAASQAVEHPKAALVTEALRRQLGLLDPLYFRHSALSYAPNARRLVYQNELNTMITAEPDGSFKRILFERLSDRTLQGITWLNEGRFLAYYYGAFGDLVTYFTATVDGQTLSEPARSSIPSLITPGASPDGEQVIIARETDGVVGYYLKRAAFPTMELLFEAEAPGNNWPGPLYQEGAGDADLIYAALPGADGARLVCFNRQTATLTDLTALPLRLARDERAWWSLAPDQDYIALYANGLNGGLWLIDLNALPCSSVEITPAAFLSHTASR